MDKREKFLEDFLCLLEKYNVTIYSEYAYLGMTVEFKDMRYHQDIDFGSYIDSDAIRKRLNESLKQNTK